MGAEGLPPAPLRALRSVLSISAPCHALDAQVPARSLPAEATLIFSGTVCSRALRWHCDGTEKMHLWHRMGGPTSSVESRSRGEALEQLQQCL